MGRTLTAAVRSCRLADDMELLARGAFRKSLDADHEADEARSAFFGRIAEGYTDLCVMLDDFESDLSGAPGRPQ